MWSIYKHVNVNLLLHSIFSLGTLPPKSSLLQVVEKHHRKTSAPYHISFLIRSEKIKCVFVKHVKEIRTAWKQVECLVYPVWLFPRQKERMWYRSTFATGSQLSPAHHTALTIRLLNGAWEKAGDCAMPGWTRRLSLLLRAAECKESQWGFIDLPRSGKMHITKGSKVHS